MSSSADAAPFLERGVSRRPSGVSEVQNGDFLSRLLAATPPYLHNTALLPPGLVFSEMLKSLVAKPPTSPSISLVAAEDGGRLVGSGGDCESSTTTSTSTTTMVPPPPPPMDFWLPKSEPEPHRQHRKRKRPWREEGSPPKLESGVFVPKTSPPPPPPPLKDVVAPEHPKLPLALPETTPLSLLPPHFRHPPFGGPPLPELPSPRGVSSFGPIFPRGPPPGMWYPALYPGLPPLPPYAIDPLHFFIDLRVSGHIWDRQPLEESRANKAAPEAPPPLHHKAAAGTLPKLEATRLPPHDGEDQVPGKSSAFSVPEPRSGNGASCNKDRSKEEDNPGCCRGTHYIMQNLSRIYEGVKPLPAAASATGGSEAPEKDSGEEGKGKGCKDLPALIGLELVVDYVQQQHDGKVAAKEEPPSGDCSPEDSKAQE